jgi:flagellar basal-body rod modification protein FlgD
MAITSTAASNVSQDLMNAVNAQKVAQDSVQAETDKFMKLLVTQLKNQDPMNPMDNAEMTSQLAQMSTVSGVNKLNATLETLKTSYQSAEAFQATNMIGHAVLVQGKMVQLSGGKAALGAELASPADSVQIIVTDMKTGKEVHKMDLGAQASGIVPVTWDGIADASEVDSYGNPIPLKDGNYSIKVVAMRGGQVLEDAKPLSIDHVDSVTTSAKDGVKLNLAGMGQVSIADIRQIL